MSFKLLIVDGLNQSRGGAGPFAPVYLNMDNTFKMVLLNLLDKNRLTIAMAVFNFKRVLEILTSTTLQADRRL